MSSKKFWIVRGSRAKESVPRKHGTKIAPDKQRISERRLELLLLPYLADLPAIHAEFMKLVDERGGVSEGDFRPLFRAFTERYLLTARETARFCGFKSTAIFLAGETDKPRRFVAHDGTPYWNCGEVIAWMDAGRPPMSERSLYHPTGYRQNGYACGHWIIERAPGLSEYNTPACERIIPETALDTDLAQLRDTYRYNEYSRWRDTRFMETTNGLLFFWDAKPPHFDGGMGVDLDGAFARIVRQRKQKEEWQRHIQQELDKKDREALDEWERETLEARDREAERVLAIESADEAEFERLADQEARDLVESEQERRERHYQAKLGGGMPVSYRPQFNLDNTIGATKAKELREYLTKEQRKRQGKGKQGRSSRGKVNPGLIEEGINYAIAFVVNQGAAFDREESRKRAGGFRTQYLTDVKNDAKAWMEKHQVDIDILEAQKGWELLRGDASYDAWKAIHNWKIRARSEYAFSDEVLKKNAAELVKRKLVGSDGKLRLKHEDGSTTAEDLREWERFDLGESVDELEEFGGSGKIAKARRFGDYQPD